MQILLLSPFFHPEPISTGKYNSQLAIALVEAGHDVEVICSHPIYPAWIPEKSLSPELPGTQVTRGGLNIKYPKKILLRRAILEIWYAWHVATEIIKKKTSFDTIICVFPPSLFSLLLPVIVSKKSNLIGIVHDLQGVYVNESKSLIKKFIKYAITSVEKKGFSNCKKLIFLSDEMRQWSIKNYLLDDKASSVNYPFTTIKSSANEAPSESIKMAFVGPEKFIVYSGALGEKQNPTGLYGIFDFITKNFPGWRAKIFSQGQAFEALEQSNENNLIDFYPLVPEKDLPYLLSYSDIQVVPQSPGTSDGSLPSKLPNIIQSGTCILCITDENSELSKIVLKYTRGAVSNSWDMESCMKSFTDLKDNTSKDTENNKDLLNLFTVESLIKSIVN